MPTDDENRRVLKEKITSDLANARSCQIFWAWFAQGSGIALLVLGGLVTLISNQDAVVFFIQLKTLAQILAFFVTVIAGIRVFLDFDNRVIVYRTIRTDLETLEVGLEMGDPVEEIRHKWEEIKRWRVDAVSGKASTTKHQVGAAPHRRRATGSNRSTNPGSS